jgi:hypothetical protein
VKGSSDSDEDCNTESRIFRGFRADEAFKGTCFQLFEAGGAPDAIRLTMLLRKTTSLVSNWPAQLMLTSVTRKSDAGHG